MFLSGRGENGKVVLNLNQTDHDDEDIDDWGVALDPYARGFVEWPWVLLAVVVRP